MSHLQKGFFRVPDDMFQWGVSHSALGVCMAVRSWAVRTEGNGQLSTRMAESLRIDPKDAEELVKAGLWVAAPDGDGWIDPEYLKIRAKQPKPRVKITKTIRANVIAAHGMNCWLCGEAIVNASTLHLDHIVPHSRGGNTDVENLRPSHGRCNILRKDRSRDAFRASLEREESP